MTTVSQIRDGLQTRLATISGLRAYDHATGAVQPPTAVVVPNPGQFISFDSTMARGSDDYSFLVYVLVSQAWTRTANDQLDGYCNSSGSTSVKAAIEGDDDLNSIVHFSHVSGVRDYGDVEYAGITYYGAIFTVEVTASGS